MCINLEVEKNLNTKPLLFVLRWSINSLLSESMSAKACLISDSGNAG